MRNVLLWCAVLLWVPVAVCAADAAYVIGPSDLLEISVWEEPELSRQLVVRTDGFVSLPLLGDVAAAGLTPPALQATIEKDLKQYLKDPRCAVILVEPRSKRVYVEGQVNAPGQILLDSEMFLTQVISLSGGFTEWADRKKIVILRHADGSQQRIQINYIKIIKGKASNIAIRPGDTIIVQ